MVKFQKHFENQLVSEWRDMYCDYRELKKEVKKIKHHGELMKQQHHLQQPSMFDSPLLSISNAARNVRHFLSQDDTVVIHRRKPKLCDAEEVIQTELQGNHVEHKRVFFAKLDEQLNKINRFYKQKEEEYCDRANQLQVQLETLASFQKARGYGKGNGNNSDPDPESDLDKNENVPNENVPSRSKVQRADKMLREAFAEFYRGLGLLRNYSSLNMTAFVKILKKYDKVAGQCVSKTYLRFVEQSYFSASDKIVKLIETVESHFTNYFAKGNRKKAMVYLRSMSHHSTKLNQINFILGTFTGCSWSLLIAFILLIVSMNRRKVYEETPYMRSAFPIFSTISLFLLHMYMYGSNVYLWQKTRINYAFIFEFAPGTEMRYQDVLLVCTGLTTLLIIGMTSHLLIYTSEPRVQLHSEIIPLIIFLILVVVLFCPLEICYKSARGVLLRSIWRIISSPMNKVLLLDFFLADQLTSQVTALRNLGYISCYYGGGYFRQLDTTACTKSSLSRVFQYLICVSPYWWRLMQCWRRWSDEHDRAHIANGGKYLSAMIAIVMKLTYLLVGTKIWMIVFTISITVATMYQLYWDLVVDWGLLQPHSANPWLRDQIILKRPVYFFSIALNIVLRLAWLYSLTHVQIGEIDHMVAEFIFAALEVFRRGHWNFYRLENEHLNNVGKYRAVRTVPLPFKDMDD